jgi:sugar phosphate isomerase/epimerase
MISADVPKLAASAAFWGNPTEPDLQPWLAEMRVLGFEAVTRFVDFYIWADDLLDGHALRGALAAEGLGLASLVTGVHDDLDRYRRLADVIAGLGCRHLVVIGGEGRAATDRLRLADLLNTLGSVVSERGVRASYHHHTDTTGESFWDVTALMDATDPTLVSLTFDAGHATKDFVEIPLPERTTTALDELWDRVALVELKDWRPETELDTAVGDGLANADALLRSLAARGYADWIVIEQNDDLGRTPSAKRACAARSVAFVREHSAAHPTLP